MTSESERTSDSERLSLASDILLAPAQLGTDQPQSLSLKHI